MSEKHENFHRIATNRVEIIVDTFRKISNLHGPNYEWSPEEVMSYFAQIDAAKDVALARFKDSKRWRTAMPADATATSAPSAEIDLPADSDEPAITETNAEETAIEPDPAPIVPKIAAKPASSGGHPRNLTIAQIMTEAEDDREMLAEMVRLYRMVIHDQAQRLGEKVEYPHATAA